MFRILVKKQLAEVFRSYFYNAKKNKTRSKPVVISLFVLFFLALAGIMGGIFTVLAVSVCKPVCSIGFDWLYFLIMSGVSIMMGAFGSVFNTYSGLYIAKDNDLLLSLPIPEKYIIASRLTNVYVLGTMYSCTAIIPALIVYWYYTGISISKIVCGILYMLIITIIVFVLSCFFGFVVAKISLKLKNKSFAAVAASLAFIAAYYFVYFKAEALINKFVANAVMYGEKIKGSAYVLYSFGQVPCGKIFQTLIFTFISFILLAATWFILKATFISIVTSSGKASSVKGKSKPIKERSLFEALLSREFSRFVSSPNYMLNCGLGILLVPAAGVVFLIKGPDLMARAENYFGTGGCAVIVCIVLIAVNAMNDMVVPSISLEGKTLWIIQSLPVKAGDVLKAKVVFQLILSGIPTLFTTVIAVVIMPCPIYFKVITFALSVSYMLFTAYYYLFLGLSLPNLHWTQEIVPLKSSAAVAIAIFGSWAIAAGFGISSIFLGKLIGIWICLLIWTFIFAFLAIFIRKWLYTKGAIRLTDLS